MSANLAHEASHGVESAYKETKTFMNAFKSIVHSLVNNDQEYCDLFSLWNDYRNKRLHYSAQLNHLQNAISLLEKTREDTRAMLTEKQKEKDILQQLMGETKLRDCRAEIEEAEALLQSNNQALSERAKTSEDIQQTLREVQTEMKRIESSTRLSPSYESKKLLFDKFCRDHDVYSQFDVSKLAGSEYDAFDVELMALLDSINFWMAVVEPKKPALMD